MKPALINAVICQTGDRILVDDVEGGISTSDEAWSYRKLEYEATWVGFIDQYDALVLIDNSGDHVPMPVEHRHIMKVLRPGTEAEVVEAIVCYLSNVADDYQD